MDSILTAMKGSVSESGQIVTKPLLRDKISEQLRHLAYARRSAKPLRIESERELARRFNVSRLSLRAAIKSLVDEGLLFQKQGSGTYILPKTTIDTIHLLEAADIKPYDPFYSEFLAELSRFIAGESMHVKVIHPEGEKVEPSEAPLIIVGLCSSRLLIELKKNYRYIVSTQSYPDSLGITQVYFDDYRIGATAAGILNELGHLGADDVWLAHRDDHERVVEAICGVKKAFNVKNHAGAIRVLCEKVKEVLDTEAERKAAEEQADA